MDKQRQMAEATGSKPVSSDLSEEERAALQSKSDSILSGKGSLDQVLSAWPQFCIFKSSSSPGSAFVAAGSGVVSCALIDVCAMRLAVFRLLGRR
jgi:hypothetical protein